MGSASSWGPALWGWLGGCNGWDHDESRPSLRVMPTHPITRRLPRLDDALRGLQTRCIVSLDQDGEEGLPGNGLTFRLRRLNIPLDSGS